MKVGDLVRWTKRAARAKGDHIGIVVDIGWTQNWIWVKWPFSEKLTLARRDALVVI